MFDNSTDTTPSPRTRTRLIFILLGILTVLVVVAPVAMFVFSILPKTVMTKRSPDGLHTARLQRIEGFDLMFDVIVDGNNVYRSPDFAPGDADFREHIYWSSDSQSVVLEVAGRRLFGYHVTDKRELTAEELANIPLTPFEELGFEGD